MRLLANTAPALTREACANMRLFIAGSAPLLIETFNEFRERTGHTILERYGMSETRMLTSNPYDGAGEPSGVAGTVGFLRSPALACACRTTRATPAQWTRSAASRCAGPTSSAATGACRKNKEEFTADGWFKTGDVGKIDGRGYVTIVGRSKDLIISGGCNVYPAEIGGYISEMPGVAESAVVGVPHPDFGEGVIAVVVAKPGAAVDADAVVGALRARSPISRCRSASLW